MNKIEKILITTSIMLFSLALIIFFLVVYKPEALKGDDFYLSYSLNTDNLYLSWNAPLLTVSKGLDKVEMIVEELYEKEVEQWLLNNSVEISDGVYVGKGCSLLNFYIDTWDDKIIKILDTKYDGCR